MTAQTAAQRSLLPTVNVPHGKYTQKCVRLFKLLANSQRVEERGVKPYGEIEPAEISWSEPPLVENDSDNVVVQNQATKPVSAKRKQVQKRVLPPLASDSDGEQTTTVVARRQKPRQRAISVSADEGDSGTEEHSGPAGSEGEGDDINVNEERSDEDSDLGSLNDFLATSSSPVRRRKGPLTESSSPPWSSNRQPNMRAHLISTQDTNDSMPDIAELVGRAKRQIPRSQGEDSDAEHAHRLASHRQKRRRVCRR